MRGSPASRWWARRHHREIRHENTKTFPRKGKPKPSQPEALSSLPLVGPEIVTHKSIFKERRPAYPIPIPQAHSWMRKCFCPPNLGVRHRSEDLHGFFFAAHVLAYMIR